MMNIKQKLSIIIYVMILLSFPGCDYFFDNEPPEIKILSPISGQTIYGSAEIIVEAKDNSKLHHVDLYLDGNMVKSFREGFFAYTWDLTTTNEDTEHTAKVKAYDARDNRNEDEVRFFGYGKSPNCPNLISPVDGGVVSFLNATLDWSDVPNAQYYYLQIDNNADFSSPFISDISLTESKYTIMISLDYKTYYWRVCAKYSWGDWSIWSKTYSFTCRTYKWKYQTGGVVSTSPAIGFNGTIYIGSQDDYLYALNSNGTLKWQSKIDKLASSPVIASDGTIYAGSGNGYLYALHSGGSVKWSFKTNDKIDSAPAIGNDGSVYIGSRDYYVYALNAEGGLKWKYGTGGSIDYSPVINAEGTIYIASSPDLLALNVDGTLKWRYRPNDGYIESPPVIGSDGTIYLSWHNNQFHALNPDGSIKWRQQISDYPKISIGQDDILYIASTLVFHAYNSTGVRKWSYAFEGSCDGSLPTIGSDGTIYFAASYFFSGNSYLYAVNSDGSLKQTYNLGSFRIYSSPAIDTDGTVYVGSCDGCLYAFPSFSAGLAHSSWPKFGHDNQNTGRAGVH